MTDPRYARDDEPAELRPEETLEALRESEERYRRLVELCPDGVLVSSGGRIAFVNLTGARILGAPRPQAVVGALLLDLVHPDHRDDTQKRLADLDGGRRVAAFETRIVRLDGAVLDVEIAATPFPHQGKPAAQIVIRDVTARKEAEEALRRQSEFIRTITDSMGEGLFVIDRAGRVSFVNPASERLLGWSREELLLRDLHQMTHYRKPDGTPLPRTDCALIEAMESGTTVRREDSFIRKDGSVLPAFAISSPLTSASGEIVGAVIVFHDVTERRALEEQLLHSQKMEAVGRLAGGIAHDFNNILSVVSGYGEMVLNDLAEGDERRARVVEILRAADRATALTRQLLAFGRRQVIEPRHLDLNAVVVDVERMLHRLIGEDIQVTTKLGGDLGAITADPGQVEQILINLAVNARDAMPNGGKLILETRNVTLDEDLVRGTLDVSAGPYVMLSVSDTGVGMDREIKEHVFEPFFTTKESGLGTGLGLATVYGIVKQSGGHVWVYSEPGWGTTFKLYFPLATSLESLPSETAQAETLGGSETILVVEDDDLVRSLIREFLTSVGYTVIMAANPEEGLRHATERADEIDLLLTDVVMPGMSGRELVDRLTTNAPNLRVLFMSGYSDEAVASRGILDDGLAFLQKPFTRYSLAAKVRMVLDEAPVRTRVV
ncbi:MAG TPA: PAS domain S-box protein [Candidatus Eisenbacteria bacterium]|nr:PAS domain S-box protein [Candidatus Eisenbacteria bacterium]